MIQGICIGSFEGVYNCRMSKISIPWEQGDRQPPAETWIQTELARGGIDVLGEIEQFHIRPWSIVLRVVTSSGLFYFKATGPQLGFETGLTAFLAQLYPQVLPQLIATDTSRGWLSMRDSGVPLRAFIKKEHSIKRWQEILPAYFEMQKGLRSHVDEMLALGVTDRRLERLPSLFIDLIQDESSMLLDKPESLTSAEYQRLLDSVPRFEQMCTRLGVFGITESLNHDDFHDGNIFLQDGRFSFTDWGDSAVTHPFLSLVVMLRGVENSLDLPPDAREVQTLREWYLALWEEFGSPAELKQIAWLAERIGYVNRALTWRLNISRLPENLRPEYALAVPGYLKEFLDSLEVK